MKTTLIPDQASELKKHFECFNKTLKSSDYKKKRTYVHYRPKDCTVWVSLYKEKLRYQILKFLN